MAPRSAAPRNGGCFRRGSRCHRAIRCDCPAARGLAHIRCAQDLRGAQNCPGPARRRVTSRMCSRCDPESVPAQPAETPPVGCHHFARYFAGYRPEHRHNAVCPGSTADPGGPAGHHREGRRGPVAATDHAEPRPAARAGEAAHHRVACPGGPGYRGCPAWLACHASSGRGRRRCPWSHAHRTRPTRSRVRRLGGRRRQPRTCSHDPAGRPRGPDRALRRPWPDRRPGPGRDSRLGTRPGNSSCRRSIHRLARRAGQRLARARPAPGRGHPASRPSRPSARNRPSPLRRPNYPGQPGARNLPHRLSARSRAAPLARSGRRQGRRRPCRSGRRPSAGRATGRHRGRRCDHRARSRHHRVAARPVRPSQACSGHNHGPSCPAAGSPPRCPRCRLGRHRHGRGRAAAAHRPGLRRCRVRWSASPQNRVRCQARAGGHRCRCRGTGLRHLQRTPAGPGTPSRRSCGRLIRGQATRPIHRGPPSHRDSRGRAPRRTPPHCPCWPHYPCWPHCPYHQQPRRQQPGHRNCHAREPLRNGPSRNPRNHRYRSHPSQGCAGWTRPGSTRADSSLGSQTPQRPSC